MRERLTLRPPGKEGSLGRAVLGIEIFGNRPRVGNVLVADLEGRNGDCGVRSLRLKAAADLVKCTSFKCIRDSEGTAMSDGL